MKIEKKESIKNNYYHLLEVQANVSNYEIRRAYEYIKSIYTKGNVALYTLMGPSQSQKMVQKIEEAYRVLGNRSLRKLYDESMNKGVSHEKILSLTALQKAANIFPHELSHVKVKEPKGKKRVSQELIEKAEEHSCCDGLLLRHLREEKEMSIDEMSEITKINTLYLKAVEENDWRSLPPPVFVQGFVRQMAKTLGLDDHKVIKSYMVFLRSQIVEK